MEENKKHLDDRFAAARRTDVPEINDSKLSRLLDAADTMQSPSQSFFSRKGIWIMTSMTTLGVAALIGYLSFGLTPTTSTQSPAPPPSDGSMLTITHVPKNVVGTSAKPPTRISTVIRIAKPDGVRAPSSNIKPRQSWLAPAQINSITTVRVSEAQYPALGLQKVNGSGLGFFIKDGKDSYRQFIIPEKGWGVVRSVTTTTEPQSAMIEPVIVTDAHGNKRMINYSDPTHVLQMTRSTNDATDSGRHTMNENMSFKLTDSSNDAESLIKTIGITPLNDSLRDEFRKALRNVVNELRDAQHANGPDGKLFHPKMVQIEVHHDDFDTDMSSNLPEIEKTIEANMPASWADSASTHELKHLIHREIRLNVNDLKHLPTDSLGRPPLPGASMITIDFGDKMHELEEKLAAKIATLIPILVRPSTTVTHNEGENVDYDNGVIMWCEPTPELTKALAEDANGIDPNAGNPSSVSISASDANGVLNASSVFPNPAQSSTSIRFSLAEPRMVAFSIHNILGQKLVDGGEIEFGAGEQTHTINLEGLPEGMYLLAITTDHGEQAIQRIVVRK